MPETLSNITDPNEMYAGLSARLHDVVPDVELRYKSNLAAEINRIKTERNAVILGHNYMEPAYSTPSRIMLATRWN